jgi:hypothetical protein
LVKPRVPRRKVFSVGLVVVVVGVLMAHG